MHGDARWLSERRAVVWESIFPVVLFTCIAGISTLAVLQWSGEPLRPFNADAEWSVPAVFSALLLVAAAVAGLLLVKLWPRGGWSVAVPTALSLLFAVMAVDELVGIHEWLEARVGVDWQPLFAPIAVTGGVAWLMLLLWLRRRGHSGLVWVLGGLAWLASQVLEAIQWEGDTQVSSYGALMLSEEALEMTGSALFLIALLGLCRTLPADRP